MNGPTAAESKSDDTHAGVVRGANCRRVEKPLDFGFDACGRTGAAWRKINES